MSRAKRKQAERKLKPAKKSAAPVTLQLGVFLIAFLIVFSRRPDAVLNAQFWAEDGKLWYSQAYQSGLHSFLIPDEGYLQTLSRSIALLSLLFPFSVAPLVMNLCASVVQILPVNVFLSSRFSHIPLVPRLVGCVLYLAIPNSSEVHANVTSIQWHLALLACLVLLAPSERSRGWLIFDAVGLVLISFSSPMGIVLLGVAAALWLKRRNRASLVSLGLLVPGAIVESLVTLLSHSREVAQNGATVARFITILGGQVFFMAVLGKATAVGFTRHEFFLCAVVAAAVGVAVSLYALRYAPFELKVFIAFSFAVFGLGLARPVAGAGEVQWERLCLPGACERYWFFPMLAFLACLVWMAWRQSSPLIVRCLGALLLLSALIGIHQDWTYRPFVDFQFQQYAAAFEQAPKGAKSTIPLNPRGWFMVLTKQ